MTAPYFISEVTSRGAGFSLLHVLETTGRAKAEHMWNWKAIIMLT